MRFLASALCLTALFSVGSGSLTELARDETVSDAQEWKQRPVARVLRLLKQMQGEVTKEGKADTEAYEKLACWCETNDKGKTEAIDVAEQRIAEATATIEEMTARSGELKTEIEKHTSDLAASEKALADAEAMREKELAEFSDEEKELLGLVAALSKAVQVLGKTHGEAPTKEAFLQLKGSVHHINLKYANLLRSEWNSIVDPPLAAFLGGSHKNMHKVLTGFEQSLEAAEGPAGYKSYNPASGEILGMLKQMKDTFTANLESSRGSEMAKLRAFGEMARAKTAEIVSLKASIHDKQVELAETDEKNAHAKEDLAATRNALSADQKFLMNLKQTCSTADADYAQRTKTRQEELVAIAETVKILTEDDARDLFGKSLSFVQKHAGKKSPEISVDELAREGKIWRPRDAAADVLRRAAAQHGSAQLSALATSAQLDGFAKVKAAIDKMVGELRKQQKEEVKKRDWCNTEIDRNEDSTKEAERNKEDLDSQISDLTSEIEQLGDDLKALGGDISNMQVQMKRAGEDRAGENKEFQSVVADQRATVAILNKAQSRLKAFYAAKDKKSFLQVRRQEPGAAVAPPPPASKDYSKSGGAHGVMTMIQMIIEDAERLQARAIKDEQSAQAGYEQFVQDTNGAIATNQREIVGKSGQKGAATAALEEAKSGYTFTLGELQKLSKMNGDLHADCDYVLKNFDIRQTARQQEMDALANAKAILSGAQFQ